MNAPHTHALLWSHSQCALHVEPIGQMLHRNRQAYADDRRMDYAPIYFGSDLECRAAADAVRGTMHSRQQARGNACDENRMDTNAKAHG